MPGRQLQRAAEGGQLIALQVFAVEQDALQALRRRIIQPPVPEQRRVGRAGGEPALLAVQHPVQEERLVLAVLLIEQRFAQAVGIVTGDADEHAGVSPVQIRLAEAVARVGEAELVPDELQIVTGAVEEDLMAPAVDADTLDGAGVGVAVIELVLIQAEVLGHAVLHEGPVLPQGVSHQAVAPQFRHALAAEIQGIERGAVHQGAVGRQEARHARALLRVGLRPFAPAERRERGGGRGRRGRLRRVRGDRGRRLRSAAGQQQRGQQQDEQGDSFHGLLPSEWL